jgi:EAL domain-containing protein (putative c-di-GMP-specific phosphodiesterase class I)
VEALLRWQHPDRGLLGPAHFAEALEDEGLAALADEQVLAIVLEDICRWRLEGLGVESVAVNATLGDFKNSHYVDGILAAIADRRIAAKDLCVEITEGMLLGHNGSKARRGIERLHAGGVRVAFDDFGTGFASLRHLRDIPVDFVKIDQSFIRSLACNPADRAIVESVIQLAHHLRKKVIAEGVETEEQAAILRALNCDYIQGYLRSEPVAGDRLPEVIARLASRSVDRRSHGARRAKALESRR